MLDPTIWQLISTERLQELREGKRETEESLIDVLAQALRHAHSATDDADLGSGIHGTGIARGRRGTRCEVPGGEETTTTINFCHCCGRTHAANRTALGQLDIASFTQDSRLHAA